MSKNKLRDIYATPVAKSVEMHTEQCIATSIENPGGELGVLPTNDWINELG